MRAVGLEKHSTSREARRCQGVCPSSCCVCCAGSSVREVWGTTTGEEKVLVRQRPEIPPSDARRGVVAHTRGRGCGISWETGGAVLNAVVAIHGGADGADGDVQIDEAAFAHFFLGLAFMPSRNVHLVLSVAVAWDVACRISHAGGRALCVAVTGRA